MKKKFWNFKNKKHFIIICAKKKDFGSQVNRTGSQVKSLFYSLMYIVYTIYDRVGDMLVNDNILLIIINLNVFNKYCLQRNFQHVWHTLYASDCGLATIPSISKFNSCWCYDTMTIWIFVCYCCIHCSCFAPHLLAK